MRMRRGVTAVAAIAVTLGSTLWASQANAAGAPSVDDFLPPVQGGPTAIAAPEKLKIDSEGIEAASAQDAMNAAVKQNVESIGAGGTDVGAVMAKFPSGLGIAATGAAGYQSLENPVASRIAQRKAYVAAFTKAKKELAEFLGGLSNEGKDTLRESLANVNTESAEMTNLKTSSEESLKQTVDMMLRGFVVYQVTDDSESQTVYVTLVTTPKTRGKLARPAPGKVVVDDIRQGLAEVLAEVRSGLVPPIGGRIIENRKTGETAFVGFGSSVVRTSKTPVVQARLKLESQKISAMRAKDALCGLIIGDKTAWEGQVNENTQEEIKEFETAGDDPLLPADPAAYKQLDEARQSFLATIQTTDVYTSARKGMLPPGVSSKTWFDEDHAWAYGMAVYLPSVTNAASDVAKEMRDAKILQGSGGKAGGAGLKQPKVRRPGEDVKKGPSGKVGSDDDL